MMSHPITGYLHGVSCCLSTEKKIANERGFQGSLSQYNPPDRNLYKPIENLRISEYRMTRNPRGHAIIFNIENFNKDQNEPYSRDMPNRKGSSLDADGLERVWRRLSFQVQRYNDPTRHDIDSVINTLARETDHTPYDCIVVCIMSHGNENGYLFDARGCEFELYTLMSQFLSSACPSLAEKPKMFFVQACQGNIKQGGYSHLQQDVVVESTRPSVSGKTQACGGNISPDEADFLLYLAAPPGYVSFRDTRQGSWFFSSLVRVLEKDAHRFSLTDILTKVNAEIAGKSEGQCIQIPKIIQSLRKSVYFRTL